MPYAIVINLDHDLHPDDVCRFLWNEIAERMLDVGFRIDGRSFVMNAPPEEACRLARETIESIESHLEFHRKHIYKYIKEFYGFPTDARTNLLVPPLGDIEVDEGGSPTSTES
jgi:hypothetical protein